jgi:hypothetical protein
MGYRNSLCSVELLRADYTLIKVLRKEFHGSFGTLFRKSLPWGMAWPARGRGRSGGLYSRAFLIWAAWSPNPKSASNCVLASEQNANTPAGICVIAQNDALCIRARQNSWTKGMASAVPKMSYTQARLLAAEVRLLRRPGRELTVKSRTSGAKALSFAVMYGTAEAVPFVQRLFLQPVWPLLWQNL